MQLSIVQPLIKTELVRDGSFDSLGFVSHRGENMLVFLESEELLLRVAQHPNVSCVVTQPEYVDRLPSRLGVLSTMTPREVFYTLHNHFVRDTDFYWTTFPTRIADSAQVHQSAFVATSDVVIGERCVIEPHAVVLSRVLCADDVVIRAGAVIGSEGFQAFLSEGRLQRVAHGGGVRLRRSVEVQANTCIDRAVFGGFTDIGECCTIDNLVHVAHNVSMGPRCRVAANAMIAGSVVMGEDVWVGPSAAISSEIAVGNRAFITLGAVVTRDVAADQHVSGNFAVDHDKFLDFIKTIR